jgi:hypothetical protein
MPVILSQPGSREYLRIVWHRRLIEKSVRRDIETLEQVGRTHLGRLAASVGWEGGMVLIE